MSPIVSKSEDFQKRILVATNLFGRGMDIERVNIVFSSTTKGRILVPSSGLAK